MSFFVINHQWTYTPPTTHDILWVFNFDGILNDLGALEGELIIFEEGSLAVDFETTSGAHFILGSTKKFDYNLVLGTSSLHTSKQALYNSQKQIESIYKELKTKRVIDE